VSLAACGPIALKAAVKPFGNLGLRAVVGAAPYH